VIGTTTTVLAPACFTASVIWPMAFGSLKLAN
jgi:hypothetical protein